MKVLILGAGKMGSFFADLLSFDHEVAVFDVDPRRLRFVYNVVRIESLEDIKKFDPDMVINASTVKYTVDAFKAVMPYLRSDCILSDIASVKTGLQEFYDTVEQPFVSTHPMFGPTFADLRDLSSQNTIIIKESCKQGKSFFHNLYNSLKLRIFEYTFDEHDETIAYSLTIPFASTLVFASVMKHQEAPGTTFKKHLNIAQGLLSEDDYLLKEILFNPHSVPQLDNIIKQLELLKTIIQEKNSERMNLYLNDVRCRI